MSQIRDTKWHQTKAAKTIQSAWRRYALTTEYRKLVKLHKYRTLIVQEMLATERSYLQQLKQVIDVFLNPLKEAAQQGRPLLGESETKIIFSKIEVIFQINTELSEALAERVEKNWFPNQLIGDIFIKRAGLLNVYSDYAIHFGEAINLLETYKKSSRFSMFVEKGMKDLGMEGVKIGTLLVVPIQRIPRYQLLLQDLLKHTWKDHLDHSNLQEALESIKKTAHNINEKVRDAQSVQKVMAIQSGLINQGLSIIDPHRRFVREGSLKLVNEKGEMVEKWFILFNDMILSCKLPQQHASKKGQPSGSKVNLRRAALAQSTVEVEGRLSLSRTSVVNVGDDGDKQNGFELVTPRDIYWLCASTPADKEEWVRDLRQCIQATKHQEESQDKHLTEVAKKKAEQAKLLIDEKYTEIRVHGHSLSLTRGKSGVDDKEDEEDESQTRESLRSNLLSGMSVMERLELQKEAELRLKALLEEEKEKEEISQQRAEEFKKFVESGSGGSHPTRSTLSSPLTEEELRQWEAFQKKNRKIKGVHGGGKRRRWLNSLPLVSSSSGGNDDDGDEEEGDDAASPSKGRERAVHSISSLEEALRNSSSSTSTSGADVRGWKQRHDSMQKDQKGSGSPKQAPSGAPLRKHASLQRHEWKGSLSSSQGGSVSLPCTPRGPGSTKQEEGADGGAKKEQTPKPAPALRKHASLQRHEWKGSPHSPSSSSSSPSSSPEPQTKQQTPKPLPSSQQGVALRKHASLQRTEWRGSSGGAAVADGKSNGGEKEQETTEAKPQTRSFAARKDVYRK
ncbi:guanine nucleotide exchange factor 9 [Balamuthia mandrillaris]